MVYSQTSYLSLRVYFEVGLCRLASDVCPKAVACRNKGLLGKEKLCAKAEPGWEIRYGFETRRNCE